MKLFLEILSMKLVRHNIISDYNKTHIVKEDYILKFLITSLSSLSLRTVVCFKLKILWFKAQLNIK